MPVLAVTSKIALPQDAEHAAKGFWSNYHEKASLIY